jgi:hypothetical protein
MNLELGVLQSGRLGSGAIGGLGHWHAFVVNLSGSILLIFSHSSVVGRLHCFIGTRGPATGHLFPLSQSDQARRRGSCAAKKGATADATPTLEASPHIPTGFISY